MTLCLGIVSVSCEELLHRQKRSWIIDVINIEEGWQGPYPRVIYQIEGNSSIPTRFSLTGPGVDQEPKGKLFMTERSPEIYLKGELDYESNEKLVLIFEAKYVSDEELEPNTRLGVEVEILDINDNAPVFHPSTYTINRGENDSKGEFLTAVIAKDKDKINTKNSTFDLKIVSINPKPTEDLEFFLDQQDTIGRITFKGCLDHQKSDKYTILVEAKDRGEMVQLSSTCTVIINIEDGNNHPPTFTGQTGVGSIKERDSGVEVLRLQVSDQDTKGTKAWKAVYTIHGDKDKNFRIITDLKTNEGVLLVEKPLDYEEGSVRNVSVSVENEEPYFSCKVNRRPPKGLWDVETSIRHLPLFRHVTIRVEDVNDPPIFTPAVKNVSVDENVAVGWYLETLTAKDLDRSYANNFLYMKGNDPAQWVAVDAKTGKITTTKILDRESPYVKNDVYQVTVFAVDDGKPPMTGTGTLNIHLKDRNDNLPQLEMTTMGMCLSDEPSKVNITAYDLDKDPYSGPFRFQLLGDDVKGKWSINPNHGYTVTLVKENTVYAGHHQLVLEVFDQQDQGVRHNLTITVCACVGTYQCSMQRSSGANIGVSAVVIFMAAILLLLGRSHTILQVLFRGIYKLAYIAT
uniref:Cadherin domain-containing protein n=1 Tax=Esox lucius TaxID=8010 RepID=A0A3P8YLA3_ESOLU